MADWETYDGPVPYPVRPSMVGRIAMVARWLGVIVRSEALLGGDAVAVGFALAEEMNGRWDERHRLAPTKMADRLKCDEAIVHASLKVLEDHDLIFIERRNMRGDELKVPFFRMGIGQRKGDRK